MHRNIKMSNLMLDSEGYLKIIDFNLAKVLRGMNSQAYTACGSPENQAPEIIKGEGYNFPADWWAVGCVAYHLMFGIHPF